MRKKSFQKDFALRSREAVLLLGRLPLSEVNRGALESAARKAAVDALLAANMRLVQACHDIAVLASSASGPGIPEGPARLRTLRAALRRAEWAALRSAEWAAGLGEASRASRQGHKGRDFLGCPCVQTRFVRGRIPVAASLLERAKSLGTGLRLLRFRPKDLRKTPRELSEKLADLMLRGKILGLYALTGRKVGSAAREFALFVPDTPTEAGIALEGSDPLTGLPVTGLIRTLLSCAEGAVPDLRGLELMDVLPSWEALPKSAKGRGESEADARSGRTPDASRDGIADSVEKFAPGSVAAKAIREGSTLEGEYRNATVLCAGIASFLETVRGAEPVRAAEQLNRLLSSFSREIEASDGVVDACVGGCLYAFWGAPAATGRDAASAADAALALRQILRALNKARVAAGRPAVRMALGLDSSPVLAGRIGSARCRSYTVAGEATRRAFLIGALNESLGTDILVSDYTLRLMGNAFLTHPVDAIRTGSKGEAVAVHALIGRRSDPACPRDLKDLKRRLASGM